MPTSDLTDLRIIGISSDGKQMCADVVHEPALAKDKIEGTHRCPLGFTPGGVLVLDLHQIPPALQPLVDAAAVAA
jgi:hypothetical protein